MKCDGIINVSAIKMSEESSSIIVRLNNPTEEKVYFTLDNNISENVNIVKLDESFSDKVQTIDGKVDECLLPKKILTYEFIR